MSAANPQGFTHEAMGCTFGVRIIGLDDRRAESAARAAFDEVDRLEELLSRFVPHSDITQLNALSAGQSVPVSIETIECLQIAAEVLAETGGAFDIAYRSRARHGPRPAPPLVFDPTRHAVGVTVAGVDLDLGAIGKGYAVDRAVAVLREWGVTAALVHSGQSTVYALGHPPDAPAWRVGLRGGDATRAVSGERDAIEGEAAASEAEGVADELRAAADEAEAAAVELPPRVALCDRALAGSGQVLHGAHIIDPRSGVPADVGRTAWALAPSGALADAYSTAFMVMAPEEVQALCASRPEISALLRMAPVRGRVRVWRF